MEVFKSILKVQQYMAGVGVSKSRRNEAQRFIFRGVEDVQNALSPALIEAGLLFFPCNTKMLSDCWRVTGGGKEQRSVTLEVTYMMAATDGSSTQIKIIGEGADMGDKAVNKALSAAYKYAILQAFCVPTEQTYSDPDAETPEETISPETPESSKKAPKKDTPKESPKPPKKETPKETLQDPPKEAPKDTPKVSPADLPPLPWEEGEAETYEAILGQHDLSLPILDSFLAQAGKPTMGQRVAEKRVEMVKWATGPGLAKVKNH